MKWYNETSYKIFLRTREKMLKCEYKKKRESKNKTIIKNKIIIKNKTTIKIKQS